MIKPWIVYLSGPITGEKHAKENFEKATKVLQSFATPQKISRLYKIKHGALRSASNCSMVTWNSLRREPLKHKMSFLSNGANTFA